MKRILSILLIFTVNLLLLTTVMACHHHHDGMPHFFATEERHEAHESENCPPCCSHETGTDFCQFDQPVDMIKVSHDVFSIPLLALIRIFIFDFSIPVTEKIIQTPYLFLYFDDWAVSCYGLRAPPVG
ncbi:MAG: hypothetical protein LBG77_03350 [Dysgonamonadaceae bacterium]|jgi:hypothetical protein|nr:hypothetical protein [Dysgonamonadaceae bacterium]